MEDLLKEWTDNFPPALGSIGSPKAVAARLKSLEKEIVNLNENIKVIRAGHDAVVHELQEQLKASRIGILTERKNFSEEFLRKEEQFKSTLFTEQQKWKSMMDNMKSVDIEKQTRSERDASARLQLVQNEKEKLQKAVDRLTASHKRLVDKTKKTGKSLTSLGGLSAGDEVRTAHVQVIQDLVSEHSQEEIREMESAVHTPVASPQKSSLKMNAPADDDHDQVEVKSSRDIELDFQTQMNTELQSEVKKKDAELNELRWRYKVAEDANLNNLSHIQFLTRYGGHYYHI
jgi:hypothetical protein